LGYFWDIFFFIKLGDTVFWDIFVSFLGKEQLKFLYGGGGRRGKKNNFLHRSIKNFPLFYVLARSVKPLFSRSYLDKNHIL